MAAITHALAAITTRLDGGNRRRRYDSDSDDSSNDDSAKENTPPPKKKRRKKRKNKRATTTTADDDDQAMKDKPEFKVWKTDKERKEGAEEWFAWREKYPAAYKKHRIELARKKLKKLEDE